MEELPECDISEREKYFNIWKTKVGERGSSLKCQRQKQNFSKTRLYLRLAFIKHLLFMKCNVF